MNIIFLDVDGVLNSMNYLQKLYEEKNECYFGFGIPFDPNCLKNLKELVTQTNSKIVVSSTWRKSEKGIAILLENLKKYELDKSVIGYTPIFNTNVTRGTEIKAYLSNLKENASKLNFIILDDESDMDKLLPYLIKIDENFGLTSENVKAGIKKLNKKRIKETNDYER